METAACKATIKAERDIDALIEAELPRVRIVAAKLVSRLPRGFNDFEELVNAGNLGLVQAARRYDGRVRFSTFVQHRILGAMLDYLRSIDLLSQKERLRGDTCERSRVTIDKAVYNLTDGRDLESEIVNKFTSDKIRLLAAKLNPPIVSVVRLRAMLRIR